MDSKSHGTTVAAGGAMTSDVAARHRTNGHMKEMIEVMPDSFAEMLEIQVKANPELFKQIKFPPWLYEDVCQRKDQSALTANEQQRFICAFETLVANGTIGKLADIHADMIHQQHGTARFFPWHRVFLRQLELALHTVHPDVCIPYWDWTKKGEQVFPSWLAGYTPTVKTPTRTIVVTRAPGTSSALGVTAANVPAILGDTTFNTFWPQMEGVHGSVHVWVGGTMSFISTASADPIFWLHHANMDRLWWEWYNSAAGSGKNPPISGAMAVLDPWPTTESDTRDPIAMGFEYI
ncbi:MAG TPA: tyrosinase family protein [Candidatus Kapabacteria bacterium]|nr:tyrosinase family protein [Candidatus Kapabacteria bacterium]